MTDEDGMLFKLSIPFPPNGAWLNLNDSYRHWSEPARRKKQWAQMTHIQWMRQGRPRDMPPCTVRTTLIFSRQSRRDAHNFIATIKPIIDQLVADSVWPDDHTGWLHLDEPVLVVNPKSPRGVILRAYPKER